jgi:hypothetical protein
VAKDLDRSQGRLRRLALAMFPALNRLGLNIDHAGKDGLGHSAREPELCHFFRDEGSGAAQSQRRLGPGPHRFGEWRIFQGAEFSELAAGPDDPGMSSFGLPRPGLLFAFASALAFALDFGFIFRGAVSGE